MLFLENILAQETIQKLGWALLHFAWQAAAVALLLAIVLRILRKSTANLRYIIACLALGLIVLLPAVTMQLVPVATPHSAVNIEPVPAPVVLPTEQAGEIPVVEMPIVEEPAEPESVGTDSIVLWKQRAAELLEPALPYIVSGWLLGVFALSVWHLGGWTQLQRLRRKMVKPVDRTLLGKLSQLAEKLGVNRTVQLVESALVQIPTVVGWLRPVILLPASALTGLNTEQLEAILAHELAHIRRYDYLVNMLQTVVEILGFYHPAVWWISHKIRAERENCCDDIAVSISGDRVRYARALTSMEEIRAGRNELAVAATGGNLFRRIRRLLGKDSADGSRASWIPSVITILLIAVIVIPTTFALTARSETEHSAEFLLAKMLEHRSKVKNLQYVVEYDIKRDVVAEKSLEMLEDSIKKSRERGASESTGFWERTLERQKVISSLIDASASRYKTLRYTTDSEGRSKIELTRGAYNSSSKKGPGYPKNIWVWNGVQTTHLYQGSGPLPSVTIRESAPSHDHPWRLFTGAMCQFLEETLEAKRDVSVEKLKDGTYRIAFDYKTRRIVAVIDPSKGYTCALFENHYKGQLNSRHTAVYEEVTKGIWFPVSGQKETPTSGGSLKPESSFKSSQIRINGPAFNASHFDVNMPEGTTVTDKVRGKRYVVGSKRAHDLDELQKPSAETEEVDPNSWQEKFYSIYSLEDGEVLKRIAPPFIPERRGYFLLIQPGRYSPNTPHHVAKLYFNWDGKLSIRGSRMGGGIPRLSTTLESVIGLGNRQYDIPPEILYTDMSGDWIVRKDTPQEELLQALEQIIKEETGKEIHFVKRKTQSKVIVARGKYRLTPLPGAKEKDYVHVYTDKIGEFSGAGGGSGTVSKFLRSVGNRKIKTIIIDKTESGDVELSWRYHDSSDIGWLERYEQPHKEKVDMLLNNLTRQTGLTFERKTVPVEKWFIAGQKSATEGIASSPVIVRSPTSAGEDKAHVRIDCLVLEIYTSMKIDRETTIATHNLLGEKTPRRIPGKPAPTIEERIREVAGTTVLVGEPSIVTGDGQTTRKMVDLLVSRGYMKILMNPTLEVVDGGTAKVSSMQKVPLSKTTTPSTQSDYYVDVIDYLQITPKVLDDGNMMLRAEGAFTEVLKPPGRERNPIFTKSSLSSQVVLGPGMSLIMGGTQETDGGAEASERRQTRVLFILTPTIVDTDEPPDETDQEQKKSKIEGETQQTDKIVYPGNWRETVGEPARQPKDPIAQDREDAQAHRRLETIVDLPGLSSGMSFDDVIGELEEAVDPPLQIQPNWRDLREAAGIEPTTPAGMDPLTNVKLGKALEILLAGISSESAKVGYVVDGGVAVIATAKALPRNMTTRVYDVTDLIGDPDDHGGLSRVMQAQNLVQHIQKRVEPESWYGLSDTGEGTATPYPAQEPKKLAVYNTLKAHRGIQRLLEKVRSGAEHVQAERPRQITISGRCLDTNGSPVSNSQVLVFCQNYRERSLRQVAKGRTDSGGLFTLGPVTALTEEDTGRRSYIVFVPADGHGLAWKQIRSYRQITDLLELTTCAPAEVVGTIVTEDSEPVVGARVWVRGIVLPEATEDPESRGNDFHTTAPLPGWSSTTDSNGSFRIPGVVDGGRIQLLVSHRDFATSIVYVKPGTNVEIKVLPAAAITGRVLYGRTGKPAAGVQVQAQAVERISIPGGMIMSWADTATDSQGRYKLESLHGVKHNVWAQADDLTAVALDSFELKKGQTRRAPDLLLVEGGYITGRVIDQETGEPVKPGAASDVAIHGPSRPRSGAAVEHSHVREDGSFRIRVAPGRNYIYLRPGEGWRRQEATVTSPKHWVEVSNGQTAEVEFKIRKFSQDELEAETRPMRGMFRIHIPKTIDELEQVNRRMQQLGLAVAMYANEHDDTLPDTLVQLKGYVRNEEYLRWFVDNVDYFGKGKSAQRNAAPIPIAYDGTLLAEGLGTYVLFHDFSVRFVERTKLQELGRDIRTRRPSKPADGWIALHASMKMYAGEHGGKLPDDLHALEPHVVSKRHFEWIVKNVEYLAPGRHLGLMQSWAPIACEKEQFAKDQFTVVLFADGHTESMYPAQIKKLAGLDRQAKESGEMLMYFGRAMLVYANDYDGKYPDSPEQLREYLKTDQLKWATGNVEYLAKGKTTSDRPDIVIAYDKTLLSEGKGTNVLFNDSHVSFEKPERLKELDITRAKIQIESRILTVSEDFLKDIGLDANSVRTSEIWSEHLLADSAAEPNSQTYRLILDDLSVSFLLRAVEAHKDARVLASPRVLAWSNEKATMVIATEHPYISGYSEPNRPSEKPAPRIEYVEEGIFLTLKSELTANNENISLDFDLEIRKLLGIEEHKDKGKYPYQIPRLEVISTQTRCLVPDGKTLLIGGQKVTRQVGSDSRVPILGDLPMVGRLFRRQADTGERQILLTLVKPTVLRQQAETTRPEKVDTQDFVETSTGRKP
jgi:type II secretory pathway component GspD/PulD (secretin)/beta-lactamase regulating signal transducer with metallopeptidase domain